MFSRLQSYDVSIASSCSDVQRCCNDMNNTEKKRKHSDKNKSRRAYSPRIFLLMRKMFCAHFPPGFVHSFYFFVSLFFKTPRKETIISLVSLFIACFAEHSDNARGASAGLTLSCTRILGVSSGVVAYCRARSRSPTYLLDLSRVKNI